MGKLRELQKNARKLANDWSKIRSQALEETKEIALDVITDDQLFAKGIDGDGSKLPLPYAPFTIDQKKVLNQPTDRITLRNTRSFHDGFFGKVTGDNMITGSSDSKSAKLHKEWGQSISSMTKANTEKHARENVLPILLEKTKNRLRL